MTSHMSKTIIGVMGPGAGASQDDIRKAYTLGKNIAEKEWVLLTGGRNVGVMEAASRGAQEHGGLTIGILPDDEESPLTSPFVDIPIYTGMGSARNSINILSSRVVVACGIGLGTSSEISLALKKGKPVILVNSSKVTADYFRELGGPNLHIARDSAHAIEIVSRLI